MKILITIPCYNEGKKLEKNILRLNNFLSNNLKEEYLIDIADNNSKDNTSGIAKKLEKKYSTIKYTYVKEQGKGLAIKYSWNNTGKNYDILSFMDADLATGIEAFPGMIKEITKSKYDLVYGSRYHPKSKTKRTIGRYIVSKGYLILQKIFLGTSFTDTQCGFKAIKRTAYLKTKDKFLKKRIAGDKNNMFFDTELLVLAKREGFKIIDYPVTWKENKETSVKLFKYSILFFKYLLYFRKHLKNIN